MDALCRKVLQQIHHVIRLEQFGRVRGHSPTWDDAQIRHLCREYNFLERCLSHQVVAQPLRCLESKDFMNTGSPQIAIDEHGRKAELCDGDRQVQREGDRKSTRLNSSHSQISYAVFCLKKKKEEYTQPLAPGR